MKIAILSPEAAPYSRTGGLGEVVSSLARELARADDVTLVTPLYRAARKEPARATGLRVDVPVRSELRRATFREASLGKARVLLVEHDPYFDREGLYGTPDGDYADNCERYVFFCRAALEALAPWRPEIVHAHDWQAALAPVYLKSPGLARFEAKSVLTIHNLAYQGLFWHWDLPLTGLDWSHFHWQKLEFWGKLNLLKGGIVHADAITTVSPTYAREILTPEHGCGLDGVLGERAGALTGILNGIDPGEWNPEEDPLIPARYSSRSLKGKAACKAALQRKLGLEARAEAPLFAFIGRLVEQKGVDLIAEAAGELAGRGLQVVVLGTGPAERQEQLEALAGPRFAARFVFDPALSHEIEAGADFLLMPSRFEPCGLTQMHSLRYGTVPVVRRTGGLADTVRDGETGIVFDRAEAGALVEAVDRALALHRDARRLAKVRRAGMAEDFGWAASARRYRQVFKAILSGP